MAIDTPARIAIIGAGPIGIEAALYARFLGYDVDLFEVGRPAEHVWQRGHWRWYTPWGENVSPLGVAALRGQDDQWQPLAADTLATGRELVERYWRPLAESDLVIDHLHLHTEVCAVARPHLAKHELPNDPARGDEDFLLLTRDHSGTDKVFTADAVLDCSGVLRAHRWSGPGGMPAGGEMRWASDIEYAAIDPLEATTIERYAGRRVLLIGAGHTAAQNALSLRQLQDPPHITWITRREPLASSTGPIEHVANDPLVERNRLAQLANALVNEASGVQHWPGTQLAGVTRDSNGVFTCELLGNHAGNIEVDCIVASVGYRPQHALAAELQLQWCPATEALPQVETQIVTTEPNYYILGAKSYGRRTDFTLSDGLRQIRQVFAILGDRADLDLYRTMKPSAFNA